MKRLIITLIVGLLLVGAHASGRSRTRFSTRKTVQLTEPKLKGSVTLEEAIAKRRSVRQFGTRPIGFTQVGQLAWAGQGITEPLRGLRAAPSAGETYPIDLYFALPEGLFVYKPAGHSLEQVLTQDVRGMLASAAGMQEGAARAACDIILAGAVRKVSEKFRKDARKFMYMEAGHIAQNIQLQAVCLNLGSVTIGGFDSREVNKICKLAQGLDPIYMISLGYPADQQKTEDGRTPAATAPTGPAAGKKAVLIIATDNFRDDELYETKRMLDTAGVQTTIAASRQGIARGMLGNMAQPEVSLNRLRVDDYDAVVFVGGPGAAEYFDNPVALNIARDAASKRKILAAISIAPTILANANVLTGIRATAFLSERQRLQQAGAIYTGNPVERDKYIITGAGGSPRASLDFGRAITDALSGK